MSNTKANAAICEICDGKLVFRGADNFECESCGVNYPKDWVRAKVQEIKGTVRIEGPVEVAGLESADVLYKRALDWLGLRNMLKAKTVLEEMIEKYPGDERGWRGLESVHEEIAKMARREEEKREKKRIAAIQEACGEIRAGKGEEWVTKFFLIRNRNIIIDSQYDFPCVRELFEEGKENASVFNSFWVRSVSSHKKRGSKFIEFIAEHRRFFYAKALTEMLIPISIKYPGFRYEAFSRPDAGFEYAVLIIGKFMWFQNFSRSEGGASKRLSRTTSEKALSKSTIQQAFAEAYRRYENKLCPICAAKLKGFFLCLNPYRCPENGSSKHKAVEQDLWF